MTPVAQLPTRRLRQLRFDTEPARRTLIESARSQRLRSQCTDGSRLTLEQSLDRVWEGLFAVGAADCPLCGERMERSREGGACSGCGTHLS
jgi:hypothetical protein